MSRTLEPDAAEMCFHSDASMLFTQSTFSRPVPASSHDSS